MPGAELRHEPHTNKAPFDTVRFGAQGLLKGQMLACLFNKARQTGLWIMNFQPGRKLLLAL